MKDNIDEFLNSYIDGELTQRQQVELQRLIKHDEKVAQRLDQLQKAKMLVASLPQVDAPAGMVDRIMTTLETRAILEHEPIVTSPRAGAAYLFGRKLVAAAAMITLMAVLAVVVYTILAPHSEAPTLPNIPITATAAPQDFHGRLELKTANFAAFNAVLARAIDSEGLEDSVITEDIDDGKTYNLTCSRDSAKALMARLSSVWQNLDTAALIVETETFAKEVEVENVTTQQIEQIVASNTLNERIDLAVELATADKLAKLVPDEDVLPGMQSTTNMLMPPMPVLTGKDNIPHKAPEPVPGERVNLTIILESQ